MLTEFVTGVKAAEGTRGRFALAEVRSLAIQPARPQRLQGAFFMRKQGAPLILHGLVRHAMHHDWQLSKHSLEDEARPLNVIIRRDDNQPRRRISGDQGLGEEGIFGSIVGVDQLDVSHVARQQISRYFVRARDAWGAASDGKQGVGTQAQMGNSCIETFMASGGQVCRVIKMAQNDNDVGHILRYARVRLIYTKRDVAGVERNTQRSTVLLLNVVCLCQTVGVSA